MKDKLLLLLSIMLLLTTVDSLLGICSSRLICPSITSEDSAGSGSDKDLNALSPNQQRNESLYTLKIENAYTAQGQVLEVKLQFTKCIPFDHNNMNGPKSYDIVAVSNITGQQTGEFIATPYNSESELCPNNTISFRTKNPTVLDMPRTYRWRPKSKESVCFRATILHYPAEGECQFVEKCLTSEQIPPIHVPKTEVQPEISIGASEKKIQKCNSKWQCDDPKWKVKTYCGCDPETNQCKTYQKRCEIKKDECIYGRRFDRTDGECPVPTTTAPTTVTIAPTLAPPPILGYCKIANWGMVCSRTGDFKLTQCLKIKETDGYKCFCANYDGTQQVSTVKTITSCSSPDIYDLKCVR